MNQQTIAPTLGSSRSFMYLNQLLQYDLLSAAQRLAHETGQERGVCGLTVGVSVGWAEKTLHIGSSVTSIGDYSGMGRLPIDLKKVAEDLDGAFRRDVPSIRHGISVRSPDSEALHLALRGVNQEIGNALLVVAARGMKCKVPDWNGSTGLLIRAQDILCIPIELRERVKLTVVVEEPKVSQRRSTPLSFAHGRSPTKARA